MSLEQKLDALVAAIEALTAAINTASVSGQPAVSEVRRGRPPKVRQAETADGAKPNTQPQPAEVEAKPQPVEAKPQPVEAKPQPVEATLADLRQVIGQLAINKGRDAAVQALANFGASRLVEIDPALYAEVYNYCKERL